MTPAADAGPLAEAASRVLVGAQGQDLSSWAKAGNLKLDPPMTVPLVDALPRCAQAVLLIEAYRQRLTGKGFA